jgi:hypothetical protein
MQTFNRICIKDYELEAKNGERLILKRGKEYTTSPEVDGEVTVFTNFWVKIPADVFAGAIEFTKP